MTTREKVPPELRIQASVPDEMVLKVAKEIAVKFIEVGRVTPATFDSAFSNIYNTINKTVRKG